MEEKTVYIVHAVDTEGPLYESTSATFERLKASFGIELHSVRTTKGTVFGPQPYLAIKTKSGRYIHDEFDFGLDGKSWYYVFNENMVRLDDVDTIGIAANNNCGKTFVKVIKVG